LAVLDQPPPRETLRAHWNVKENDALDGVPDRDWFWLGRTDALGDPQPGRAARVFELLYRVGTEPDYNAPQITSVLVARIMKMFREASDDGMPSATAEELEAFLVENENRFLLTQG
jgi:hypothetical protein